MKGKNRRYVLGTLCGVASSGFAVACSTSAKQGSALDGESVNPRYESLKALTEGVRWASKWWNIEVDGKSFAVCLQELPSYGQSRQGVFAWRKDSDGSFAIVWSFLPVAVGPVEVQVEAKSGAVTVRAKGRTEFQDSVIALAQLSATSE